VYAFWTPYPPARTGTADYADALVRLLSEQCRITLVVPDDAPAGTAEAAAAARVGWIRASDYGRIAREVALDVYFLANNRHHLHVLRQAEQRPGVLVIHEDALSYAYQLLSREEDPAQWYPHYLSRIRAIFPDHPNVLGAGQLELAAYIVSPTGPLLRASRGVVVHSPALAKRLSLETETPVQFVPHPPLPDAPALARTAAWKALAPRLPARPVLFGSLGFASRYKRLPVVFESYARFAAADPRAARNTALVFAGQADEEVQRDLAAARSRLDLGEGTWVNLPYLEEPELQVLVDRLALVLNLRYPSCGEASGILTRCLLAGRPTAVSDHAYGGTFPDDVVLKIPVAGGEVEALAAAFARAARGTLPLAPARIAMFARDVFDGPAIGERFARFLEGLR
jgi:hypothetical protein